MAVRAEVDHDALEGLHLFHLFDLHQLVPSDHAAASRLPDRLRMPVMAAFAIVVRLALIADDAALARNADILALARVSDFGYLFDIGDQAANFAALALTAAMIATFGGGHPWRDPPERQHGQTNHDAFHNQILWVVLLASSNLRGEQIKHRIRLLWNFSRSAVAGPLDREPSRQKPQGRNSYPPPGAVPASVLANGAGLPVLAGRRHV